MAEPQKWEIVRSHFEIHNRWCKVRRDEVRLPNGETIDDFYVNVRPDIAIVLAVTDNREIVFVRQYRHGTGQILMELPAGGFDPNREDAEVAAARELQEETGYTSDRLLKFATIYENPIKDTNQIHLFLAPKVRHNGRQILDVTEDIEVVLVPIAEVIDKIYSGEICVSGTISAVFMGLDYLKQSEQV